MCQEIIVQTKRTIWYTHIYTYVYVYVHIWININIKIYEYLYIEYWMYICTWEWCKAITKNLSRKLRTRSISTAIWWSNVFGSNCRNAISAPDSIHIYIIYIYYTRLNILDLIKNIDISYRYGYTDMYIYVYTHIHISIYIHIDIYIHTGICISVSFSYSLSLALALSLSFYNIYHCIDVCVYV